MYILGISTNHTATATLLKDGKVIACASEERFNGKKNFNGFPRRAIEWCLAYAGISGKDLALVTGPYVYRVNYYFPQEKTGQYSPIPIISTVYLLLGRVRESLRLVRFHLPFLRPMSKVMYRLAAKTIGKYYAKKQKQITADFLGIDVNKVIYYDHHLSHAAAAYYASVYNQQKALVLTLDGEGDNYAGSVSIFDKNSISVLARIPRECSMGYIYGLATKFLGMKPHEHEYKVMGLAPYAKQADIDTVYRKIESCIRLDPRNPLQFETEVNAQDFLYYLDKNLKHVRFDYIAGAFQQLIETRLVEWVTAAVEKTGITTVIVGGGVFMNVKANQKLNELKKVKKLYVLPSCADESAPLGSAYLGYREMRKTKSAFAIEPISDIYWGPSFTNEEIEKILRKEKAYNKYSIKNYKNIDEIVGRILSDGHIVARVAGRMEFGARALGNRSILADPRNFDTVRVINEQVKNRDFWMPFAPSILYERRNDYVKNPREIDSRFMMLTFDTTELGQKELKAAMHPYDFTVRPQFVHKEINPRYHGVIKEFENITGVGAVLNTSFNLHGFPIVLGPKEALKAFNESGMRYLAIENYLVTKK